MPELICPDCGRQYEERPPGGYCEDCHLVELLGATQETMQAVRSAKLHQRGKRVRNVLVSVGIAVGLLTGVSVIVLTGTRDILTPFVLPIWTAGTLWGLGMVFWERRVDLWDKRTFWAKLRVFVTAAVGLGGIGLCGSWHLSSAPARAAQARHMWQVGLRRHMGELASCFADPDDSTSLGQIELLWKANPDGNAVVSSRSDELGDCLSRTGNSWPPPPLDEGASVACDFVAKRRATGAPIGVEIQRPQDVMTHGVIPCRWRE